MDVNETRMEGTWGKRVFGSVTKDEMFTTFYLQVETRYGQKICSRIMIPNLDLEHHPDIYAYTLDRMVFQIDRHQVAMRNY